MVPSVSDSVLALAQPTYHDFHGSSVGLLLCYIPSLPVPPLWHHGLLWRPPRVTYFRVKSSGDITCSSASCCLDNNLKILVLSVMAAKWRWLKVTHVVYLTPLVCWPAVCHQQWWVYLMCAWSSSLRSTGAKSWYSWSRWCGIVARNCGRFSTTITWERPCDVASCCPPPGGATNKWCPTDQTQGFLNLDLPIWLTGMKERYGGGATISDLENSLSLLIRGRHRHPVAYLFIYFIFSSFSERINYTSMNHLMKYLVMKLQKLSHDRS